MLPTAISDPQLSLCIAKLGRSRFRSVGIDADVIVEKPADVNLPERFLRDVVGKMFELLPNFARPSPRVSAAKLSGGKSRRDIRGRDRRGRWTCGQASARSS